MAEAPTPPKKPKVPPTDYDDAERREIDRRQTDHPFAGLPIWARVIAMVGIPGALVFFLVWVGSTYMPKMYAELVAIRLEEERSRMLQQQAGAQLELNYRLLQRICSNVAKTDEDRQRCFDR